MSGALRAVFLHDGEILSPDPQGRGSVLLIDGRVAAVGVLSPSDVHRGVDALGLDLEILEARGLLLVPGLIDPHEHLLGPSGEEGFSSRGPEIFCVELVQGAITTVVGTLGTDNTMRTPVELLAKVKALEEEGLTAFMYSGGYTIPPATLTGSLRNDLLFIDEVVGAGEIAVSDARALSPTARELASVAIETRVGGMLARKAGVTHVHLGAGGARVQPLVEALESFQVEPAALYPTHITRSRELLRDAIALAHRGCFVDIDTTEEDLPRSLAAYRDGNGRFEQLTVSTDAGGSSPVTLLRQLAAARTAGWTFEQLLPLVTANPARVLGLSGKGRLAPGCDGDVVALDRVALEPVHVVARGKVLMRGTEIVQRPDFLRDSNREVTLSGENA